MVESEDEGSQSGGSQSDHESNGEDAQETRQIKKKKSRHSEPMPRRRQKSDEYAEDEGRAQSKYFKSTLPYNVE